MTATGQAAVIRERDQKSGFGMTKHKLLSLKSSSPQMWGVRLLRSLMADLHREPTPARNWSTPMPCGSARLSKPSS